MPALQPRIPLLPPDIKPMVDAELRPGESITWFGQPGPRALPGCMRVFMVLFGLAFTSFSVFWMVMAVIAGSHFGRFGWIASLFGLPFIAAGLGLLTSPVWMRKKLAKTVYLLTNRRAVIIEPGFFRGRTVHSYRPDRLTSITRTEHPDGSGDLVFEQFTTQHGSGHSTTRRGFIAIDNVREVETLLTQLADSDRQRRNDSTRPPT